MWVAFSLIIGAFTPSSAVLERFYSTGRKPHGDLCRVCVCVCSVLYLPSKVDCNGRGLVVYRILPYMATLSAV